MNNIAMISKKVKERGNSQKGGYNKELENIINN